MPVADAVIDNILQRIDLVELIGRTTPLKRAGRDWKGLCPFHREKTPSFTVSVDKQLYYCFGCNAGGNAFTFLMQTEQLSFREALERLATQAGVVLEDNPGAQRDRSAKAAVIAANHVALRYFQESLRGTAGEVARAYLTQRGVSAATIEQFALGYAPDAWEGLLQYAARQQVNAQQLTVAGLLVPRSDGRSGAYDRFRHRVMFAIHDVQGAVIGFGGRTLTDAQEPKYMNSPETPAFVKGRQLFGLGRARQAITTTGHALLVEGYMDCLMLHQHGIAQTVAPLGVALTSDHARLLKRYTTDVVLLFDADDAGARATLRGLDVLVAEGINVRMARIDAGMDPDEFVLAHGAAALNERIAQAQSLFDYKLGVLRRQHAQPRTEDRVAICHAMLETVRRMPDPVLQRAYVRRLAETLQLDEPAILKSLQRPGTAVATAGSRRAPAASPSVVAVEVLLIGLLLEDPSAVEDVFSRVAPEQLMHPQARQAAEALRALVQAGETVNIHAIVTRSDDAAVAAFLAQAAYRADACESKQRALADCLARLAKDWRQQQRADVVARIHHAEQTQDHAALAALLRELDVLNKQEDPTHGQRENDPVAHQTFA